MCVSFLLFCLWPKGLVIVVGFTQRLRDSSFLHAVVPVGFWFVWRGFMCSWQMFIGRTKGLRFALVYWSKKGLPFVALMKTNKGKVEKNFVLSKNHFQPFVSSSKLLVAGNLPRVQLVLVELTESCA